MNKFKTKIKVVFEGEIEVGFPEEHYFEAWDRVLKFANENKEKFLLSLPPEMLPDGGSSNISFKELRLNYNPEVIKEDD